MTESGLRAIEKSTLIGKFKVWCLQFMLIPRLLWPHLSYDVTACKVEEIERKISTAMKKWLGAQRGLTDVDYSI